MSPRLRRFLSILGSTLFTLWAVWLAVSVVRNEDAPATQIFLGITGSMILVALSLVGIYKTWRETRQPPTEPDPTLR